MRCLCCNKEIKKETEKWHASCIKKFFGTTKIKFIDLSDFKNNINNFGEKIINDKIIQFYLIFYFLNIYL